MTAEVEIGVKQPQGQGHQHQKLGGGEGSFYRVSEECGSADTLISDLQPPELRANKCLLL